MAFARRKKKEQRQAERQAAREKRELRKAKQAEREAQAQAAQKQRGGRKKRSPKRQLVLAAILCVIVLMLLLSVYRLIKLQVEEGRMQSELTRLEEERDALEDEYRHVNEDSYVEQQARDLLHMIKEGEVLYMYHGEHGDTDREQQ